MSFTKPVVRYLKPLHYTPGTTSATFVAGTVYLLQIEVIVSCWVDAIVIPNVATASGFITVGIYGVIALTSDTPAASSLIVQSASTAQTGTNTSQAITFTETYLRKGKYYLAFEMDNATGTVVRQVNQRQVVGWTYTYIRGGGYGTLTDPCPAVNDVVNNMPSLVLRVSR